MLDNAYHDALKQAKTQQKRHKLYKIMGIIFASLIVVLLLNGQNLWQKLYPEQPHDTIQQPTQTDSAPIITQPLIDEEMVTEKPPPLDEHLREDFQIYQQQTDQQWHHIQQQAYYQQHSNDAQWADIINKRQQALEYYSQGLYRQAIETLEQKQEMMNRIEKTWQEKLQQILEHMQQAYYQNHGEAIRQYLPQAMAIDPNHPKVEEWQTYVQHYDDIQMLYQHLAKAKAENNNHSMIKILEDLHKKDTKQQAHWQQELTYYQQQLKEQEYQNLIQQILALLQESSPHKADVLYQQALHYFPNRPELAMLKNTIETAQKKLDLTHRLQTMTRLSQEDQWQALHTLIQDSLKLHPQQQDIKNFAILTEQILAIHQQSDEFIAHIQEFSDQEYRQKAVDFVNHHNHMGNISPSLQEKFILIQKTSLDYSQKIPVTFLSDNQTYITIIQIGHIGVTHQKTIELLPGTYRIEGTRPYYKSKIHYITLEPHAPDYHITIICDEAIP